MGKKHSKEESARRKERQIEKTQRQRRRVFRQRCRFHMKRMETHAKTHGFSAWSAWSKKDEKVVVLKANFVDATGIRIDYTALDTFFSDLKDGVLGYTSRMSNNALHEADPEEIVRMTCTMIWNSFSDDEDKK